MGKNLKSRVVITKHEFCKGCGICIAFCPKKALTPQTNGKPVWNNELCIRCGLCELRCPDFAIYLVEEGETK